MSEQQVPSIQPPRSASAREKMINDHLPFVRFQARKLTKGKTIRNGLEFDDLVSYGIIGLIHACDRWEPAQGVSFPGFAASRIRGAMIDAIRAYDHLPRTARQRVSALHQTTSSLAMELEREPHAAEVRTRMGLGATAYQDVLTASQRNITSLEAQPLSDGPYDPPADAPAVDWRAEQECLWDGIASAIAGLPERERLLLALLYKEECTRREAAAILGISETRVAQLHQRAIGRIKAHQVVREYAA